MFYKILVICLSACVEGILRLFTIFYLHRKFSVFLRKGRYCKTVEGLDIFEKLLWLQGCCVEGILWLFTNFYLHRKVSFFLRNDSDCKDVDLYNTRKRYAVIESLDLTRNISWLASCFSKIKKPNKHCSGNQSVIAGVCIFWHDFLYLSLSNILIWTSTCESVRYKRKMQNWKIQSKRVLGLMKYTHWLADHNKVTQ